MSPSLCQLVSHSVTNKSVPSSAIWSPAQLPDSPGCFARNRLSRSPIDPQCLLFSCSSCPRCRAMWNKNKTTWHSTSAAISLHETPTSLALFYLVLWSISSFFLFFSLRRPSGVRRGLAPSVRQDRNTVKLHKRGFDLAWACEKGTAEAGTLSDMETLSGLNWYLGLQPHHSKMSLLFRARTSPPRMSTCFSKPSHPSSTYPLRGCSSPIWIFKLPKFVCLGYFCYDPDLENCRP